MADTISTPGLSMELIAAAVQKELAFKAKLRPYITDVSVFAEAGLSQISFPKLTSFSVVNRTAGVAGDATALVDSKDTLSLDENAYVAWIIDSMSKTQTRISAQIENATRAAAAQSRYVDEKIIEVVENDATAIATTSALITRDVILEMQEDLLTAHADADKLSLWISPAQRTALLQIDEFTRADAYGSSNIPGGVVGTAFGVPIVLHSGLDANSYYMVEKDAVAIGFQKGLSMDEQPANEYGVGAKRVAQDQLFGVKSLQSGLMVKDNN